MPNDQLLITVIQPDIVWENKAANLEHYAQMIAGIEGRKEVVLLPEMFSTGFSMAPERMAESMDGPTVAWMRAMAKQHRIILAGSVIIEEEGHYYNRFIWMQPDGACAQYDKRHLFGYADEDQHYTAGDRRVIVQVKGWKLCLLVCYDLRFPVWARNMVHPEDGAAYDVLLYVANWPQRRSLAWKTLLQARAIENQSYVVGVNRVGVDGKEIAYSGDSSVFGPLGEVLYQEGDKEAVHTIVLDRPALQDVRGHFPFLGDGDRFVIV